jgi:hypothetical protein
MMNERDKPLKAVPIERFDACIREAFTRAEASKQTVKPENTSKGKEVSE